MIYVCDSRSFSSPLLLLKSRAVSFNSGISTWVYPLMKSGRLVVVLPLPSKAHKAMRLPSIIVSDSVSGADTPIISADSRLVDTDERRLWWEFGRERGVVPEGIKPNGVC